MEKEDRELIKLLNDSKKGNKNSFEKFTRLVYQEVYNLVAFVYITKESREKLTKHVLVRMFKNASEFDNEELDIHLWIARFTTVEVYNVCKKQNGELFDTQISAEEYNYDSISEDSEFAKCAADYNQAFLDIDQLNEIMTDFEDFSKGQRLLYLMFAYESYTIDEIEDLLEIDSTFIGTQIMQIRGMLGLDMVSLDGDGPQVHVADEDSSEDETDDEDSSDDSVPEIDFDDNDNYSDRYDAKSANHGIKADARMRGIIAICAALVVVLAVVTVAIAGRIKKNKSKSTFNPTPVTTAAEEATTKKSSKNNNATTKAAETTTTKAAETDEQTEAATTRRTQTQTNDTEAAGDTEDGGNAGTGGDDSGNAGGSGSGDSGSTDGSGSGDSGSTDGSGSGDSGDTGGSGSGDSGSTGGSGSGDSGNTDGSGSGDSGSTGGSGSGDSGSTGGSGSGDSGSTGGSGSGDSGSTGGSGSGDSGSTGGSGSGDSGSTGGSGSGDSGSTGGSGSGDSGNIGGSESGSETGSSEAAGN
ncbi:MAG: RNA polymerase sigma factor [Lachnospira sp.]